MTALLWRSGWRYLARHPWQPVLSLLGIALGVAVVIAVDLANESARASFHQSMTDLTGSATHRIVPGPQGIPEELYTALRLQLSIHRSAPLVTGYAALLDGGGLVRVLGVDPFAEGPFRGYLEAAAGADTTAALTALITQSNTVLVPRRLASQSPLRVRVGQRINDLHVVGVFSEPTLDGLIVTDISTAQALFHKQGQLSDIHLVLAKGEAGERQAQAIAQLLTPGLRLESTASHDQAGQDLSAAFQLNLTAMSLLALLVGMFLIYNTMTFSVVVRRRLWGLLRTLGVERRQVFALILGEALLLGLAGTVLGSLLGIWLGSFLVHLVTRTINDLYYVLTVQELALAPLSLAKGAALGLVATLIAAWLPAREAAQAHPTVVLSRADLETRWTSALGRLALAALVAAGLGLGTLVLSQGLVAGFVGLFLGILACALLAPVWVAGLARLAQRTPGRHGLLARMAFRDARRSLSRTGVAVAALMVAFAAAVGVGIMVDSFRSGVAIWIGDLLTADFYVTTPALEGGDDSAALNPLAVAALRETVGPASVATYRRNQTRIAGRTVSLTALDPAPATRHGYRFSGGDPDRAWAAFEQGAVLISEPLAYRLGLTPGDNLAMGTDFGPRRFPVAGVFHDYGSEHGRVLLHRNIYDRWWNDPAVGSAAIHAPPDAALAALRRTLEQRLAPIQALVIHTHREIRDRTLAVFDRTFTVTGVLRLLAVMVAFVGVLSALMALQMERSREFAMLRAMGMTPGEVGWLVTWQTGFLGLAAGLMAVPVGLGLALVLIHVINRRAFGWTMPFEADPWLLAQTVALAVLAALLAGLYPIWRMARSRPADALRGE